VGTYARVRNRKRKHEFLHSFCLFLGIKILLTSALGKLRNRSRATSQLNSTALIDGKPNREVRGKTELKRAELPGEVNLTELSVRFEMICVNRSASRKR
jgi:hypothetical protein